MDANVIKRAIESSFEKGPCLGWKRLTLAWEPRWCGLVALVGVACKLGFDCLTDGLIADRAV
jgi:hypothetical protein